jgi:hypothetical protein
MSAIQRALLAAGAVSSLLHLCGAPATLAGARASALHVLGALLASQHASMAATVAVVSEFEAGGGVGVMKRCLEARGLAAMGKAHAAGGAPNDTALSVALDDACRRCARGAQRKRLLAPLFVRQAALLCAACV